MSQPKVLYLVTEPWYFANHRLDHARALIADGFAVDVATRRGERLGELVEAGCGVHEVELGRGGGRPSDWWREIRAVRRLVRAIRPDIVHAVALKPLAVTLFLLPIRRRPALVLSVNGLGLTSTQGRRKMAAIRAAIRIASRAPRVHLLFQTRADQRAVTGGTARGVVIPGVGVDTRRFAPLPRPTTPPVRFVYLGRAVRSKGLRELAEAVAGSGSPEVTIDLYCALDETSPGSLTEAELERIGRTPGVSVHPPTSQPQDVLGRAHAAILPSRSGEGVSKFVLEALACGTPVVLSAESGSAEVIENGVTGVVFSASDPASLRAALADVAEWSTTRREEISAACRRVAESQFSIDLIAPQIVALHRNALAGGH